MNPNYKIQECETWLTCSCKPTTSFFSAWTQENIMEEGKQRVIAGVIAALEWKIKKCYISRKFLADFTQFNKPHKEC